MFKRQLKLIKKCPRDVSVKRFPLLKNESQYCMPKKLDIYLLFASSTGLLSLIELYLTLTCTYFELFT